MEFKRNSLSITIDQLNDETLEIFNKRGEFILNAMQKYPNKYSEDELIKFSKIWINIKYKGCKYQSKIYNTIRSFTKDLKIKIEDYEEVESSSGDSDSEISEDEEDDNAAVNVDV